MAANTGIYNLIQPIKQPSMMEAQKNAASLSGLQLQNQRQAQDIESADMTAHLQKAAAFGEALEGLSGLTEEERAQAYPQVRAQLLQGGIIKPEDAPDQYDPGLWRQNVMRYRQSKPGIEKQLQLAQINNLKASAAKSRQEKVEKPTADQFKAGMFGQRAEQAEGVFNDLTASGYNRADLKQDVLAGAGDLPLIGRFVKAKQPEQLKKQDQAERNFINAVLRRESGAVISDEEFANAEQQYFPRPGDTADLLAQKAENRRLVMDSLNTEAGPALAKIQAGRRMDRPSAVPANYGVPRSGAYASGGGDAESAKRQARIAELRKKLGK